MGDFQGQYTLVLSLMLREFNLNPVTEMPPFAALPAFSNGLPENLLADFPLSKEAG
jgi:hypothetical protein